MKDAELTTYELIKAVERIDHMCDDMKDIIPYIKAEIELKKKRAAFFGRLSEHFVGVTVIAIITKFGAVILGLCLPYIITKLKEYSGGL